MDHAAFEYLKRRAAEEIQKANAATSKPVASAHRAMADAYYLRIRERSGTALQWVDDQLPGDHQPHGKS